MSNQKNVSAVVVQVEHTTLKSKFKSYNHTLWGKTVLDWTKSALGSIAYTTISVLDHTNCLPLIQAQLDESSEYTVVIFSDTPLLTQKTVSAAIAMFCQDQLEAMRLTRGYVFLTAYLKKLKDLDHIKTYYFDEEDFITASGYEQMALISDILRQRILSFHMKNGVYILDTASTYIDADVLIDSGTVLYPNNHLQGKTQVKANCVLQPNNIIKNSILQDGVVVTSSNICDCNIGKNCTIGPYAYLRNHAEIGDNVRVGDYVEIKAAKIGNGSKIAHLTYVGDAEIGTQCNLGCGVVFANYDGKSKHKSMVGNRVFIGSNCNLIAPVVLHDDSFIAAGTTVTADVPESNLCIGRSRQEVKYYKSKYLSEDEK